MLVINAVLVLAEANIKVTHSSMMRDSLSLNKSSVSKSVKKSLLSTLPF